MAPLARHNLFHDRIRFVVTLTGIVFALVLAIIHCGFFLGFAAALLSINQVTKLDPAMVFKG